jgi:hypothetical protein
MTAVVVCLESKPVSEVVPSERSNLMNRDQSNLQEGSTKDDDVTIDTSSSVVGGRQQHQVLQEKLLSCDHLFPSARGQAQRTA